MSSAIWRPFCLDLKIINLEGDGSLDIQDPNLCIIVTVLGISKQRLDHQIRHEIDGLVQGRRNSSAFAMKLRLPCTNPSIVQLFIGHYDYEYVCSSSD